MSRKTLEQITLGSSVAVAMKGVVKNKKLSFFAVVGTDEVCDVTGKLKKYADVDTFAAGVMSLNPLVSTIVATLDVAGLKNPRIPTDPIAEATAQKTRYQQKLSTAVATQAKLASSLLAAASYQNSPNLSLVARWNELSDEKEAVDDLVVYLNAAIAAQNAIITPAPPPAPI